MGVGVKWLPDFKVFGAHHPERNKMSLEIARKDSTFISRKTVGTAVLRLQKLIYGL